jgi:hypothetical protein
MSDPGEILDRRIAAVQAHLDDLLSRRAAWHTELQEVARVYREHLTEAPVEAVARAMGYPLSTAPRKVQQARAAGYLPPTTPGKRRG